METKKLRILMLNYEFPPLGGGASPVSYELAKGYVKLGHEVSVVTMGFHGLPSCEVKDGIHIYRVPCMRSKKEICHPWEQYSYLLSAKKFLKQHFKTNSYDINHTHFIIPTGVLALWVKKNYGIPYIVTSHGSDVLGYNNRFKYLYPLLKSPWVKIVKEAKVVVTPSKFLQGRIKEITQEGNLAVIPNGIDPKKFKPLKKEKKILVVARLFPNKGVQDILDALKGIDMNGWKVDIVGEGPYRSFLENKTKENGLSDIVRFYGWIDNSSPKMAELYGHASIFISASYFESFGLTILEAMSAKSYPILSDIQGHQEIFKKESFFFKKGDVLSLRNKIEKTLNGRVHAPTLSNIFYLDNIVKEYVKELS